MLSPERGNWSFSPERLRRHPRTRTRYGKRKIRPNTSAYRASAHVFTALSQLSRDAQRQPTQAPGRPSRTRHKTIVITGYRGHPGILSSRNRSQHPIYRPVQYRKWCVYRQITVGAWRGGLATDLNRRPCGGRGAPAFEPGRTAVPRNDVSRESPVVTFYITFRRETMKIIVGKSYTGVYNVMIVMRKS